MKPILIAGLLFAAQLHAKPIKVFILAGQSNMEGQAVIDLAGKSYNDGKGTLVELMKDPAKAPMLAHLKSADGKWAVREDVWMRYRRNQDRGLLVGPLTTGFSIYGEHHFGPELQFGHVVGDAIENQVLLVKTAWGGKSLFADFRPPSSGGTVGPYYTKMIAEVREAVASLPREFPSYHGEGCEIAGLVWYQGWNDGCMPQTAALPEYEQNLVNLIHDVRKEFNVPKLPVVIGELTGPWVQASGDWETLRKAQAAAAMRAEFRGNVIFVPTHDFVRKPEDSPNPSHGHHEFGNAETYFLVGDALGKGMLSLLGLKPAARPIQTALKPTAKTFVPVKATAPTPVQEGEMAGYLFGPAEKVPEEFNGGFSLYAAAWPLVGTYPGHQFQTGLCGTWMHPQWSEAEKPKEKCYTDIEGGLGWWRDTHFPTTTPKFIMGGVGPNFSVIANGPGYGAGTWEKPRGQYGVAQLSPWLLFPLDGLNLKQGTNGELFGYGYLPLPLTNPKTVTAGKNVPTGNHCWTLFLHTGNFKGPVAFFTPFFWSQAAIEHPEWAGLMLDSRPAGPNKAIQMETQHVPAILATAADGTQYARVAPTSFPINHDGHSAVLHRITAYKKAALWDDVQRWFAGGITASGAVKADASAVHPFREGGGSNWSIYLPGTKREEKVPLTWKAFATSFTPDPVTFGYRWNAETTRQNGPLVTLPEYYRLGENSNHKPQWEVIAAKDVPPELGLTQHRFATPSEKPQEPRTTPDDPASTWKKPGPAAGPFKARLGDGSTVTYYWYRFADQPAMLNADLTPAEREAAQQRVEKLHRAWTKDRDYLTPPDHGKLADLDPALILTPPKGMEIGYVPIATRQELEGRR